MKKLRLFLHIGHPKTGTTSIQSFLIENRDALLAQGILVPRTGAEKGAHHGFTDNFYSTRRLDTRTARNEERLRAEVSRSGCHTVVLSSEGFIQENPARLAGLLGADCDPFVIYYIRRQDRIVESVYAQRVRSAIHLLIPPIEAVIPTLMPRYLATITRFERAFARARILVRPFEKAAFRNGRLLDDFLVLIGADPAPFPAAERRYNESFKRHYLEFKRHCNLLPLLEDEHQALNEELSRLSAADPTPQPPHTLSHADRVRILAACAEENAAIAKAYLGRPDGALFTEAPPEDDADFRPIAPLPAPVQQDLFERLSAGVRENLEFLDRGIRRRLPDESFLPAIPEDSGAVQRAIDRRETDKILRRIGRMEHRLAESLSPASPGKTSRADRARRVAGRILRRLGLRG